MNYWDIKKVFILTNSSEIGCPYINNENMPQAAKFILNNNKKEGKTAIYFVPLFQNKTKKFDEK